MFCDDMITLNWIGDKSSSLLQGPNNKNMFCDDMITLNQIGENRVAHC